MSQIPILHWKHWQVFVLVAVSFLAGFIVVPIVAAVGNSAEFLLGSLQFIIPIWYGTTMGYLLLTGMQLARIADVHESNAYRFFAFALSVSLAYGVVLPMIVFEDAPGFAEQLESWLPFVIPLHLFSVVANLNALRFVAKTLVSIERAEQGDVSLADYLTEFFLLWFLPVGVWILQPRMNRIAAARAAESTGREFF